MKQNFKIILSIAIIFLFSFLVLGLFLEIYSHGILTSEKNIVSVGGIFNQNPKQITLDVLENILIDSKSDNVNMNSLGFRGDEFEPIKPDNTYRIFVLGPSQIFGTGATSDDTTIPGFLENYLENENKSFTIEVINSGMQGVDSRKELLLLQNMLLQFTPDLVIVYDGYNDLRAGTSATQLIDNWNSMCKLGKTHNFDVVVILQPIIGFSQKSMTQKELVYLQNSKDYENNDLINSFDQYNLYAKNLEKLEHCTNKIDLRNVFDNELKSIYIDEESHISDNGNSIVANSIFDIILPNISKENILNHPINNEAESINSNISIELEYFFNNVFSNFVKKLELNIFSLSQTNDSLPNILKSEEIIIETQSLFFENNEIKIIIELAPSFNQSSNDKIIKIKTMDETNNSIIHNVTYLITITKNMNELFTNYFFAEDELIIQTTHNDENVKISGERRYELNALVVNSDIPIIISGDFFDSNSTYEFDISLRTIHDPENYIFLNGFHAEIIP